MESIYDDQILKRALLRDKYTQVVSNLLKELNSQAKTAYAHDELTNLGVSLGCFDPSDTITCDLTRYMTTPRRKKMHPLPVLCGIEQIKFSNT